MSYEQTCMACQLPIYLGQRAINLEFGTVEQSTKSQRPVVKGYAIDTIHFGCIHTYMSRINNEVYDSIRQYDKQEIRKQVILELREELRQEVYDEIDDELKTTCAVCQERLEDEEAEEEVEDLDPAVCSQIQYAPEQPNFPAPPQFPFPMPK